MRNIKKELVIIRNMVGYLVGTTWGGQKIYLKSVYGINGELYGNNVFKFYKQISYDELEPVNILEWMKLYLSKDEVTSKFGLNFYKTVIKPEDIYRFVCKIRSAHNCFKIEKSYDKDYDFSPQLEDVKISLLTSLYSYLIPENEPISYKKFKVKNQAKRHNGSKSKYYNNYDRYYYDSYYDDYGYSYYHNYYNGYYGYNIDNRKYNKLEIEGNLNEIKFSEFCIE